MLTEARRKHPVARSDRWGWEPPRVRARSESQVFWKGSERFQPPVISQALFLYFKRISYLIAAFFFTIAWLERGLTFRKFSRIRLLGSFGYKHWKHGFKLTTQCNGSHSSSISFRIIYSWILFRGSVIEQVEASYGIEIAKWTPNKTSTRLPSCSQLMQVNFWFQSWVK
jgi:hypothetical protein